MKNLYLILAFTTLIGLSSCEDVVNPNINSSKPVMIVDAFLTNEPIPQTIRLTQTIGFLDNTTKPPIILGATVSIKNSENQIFNFIDEKQDGNYTWKPSNSTETLGNIGTSFILTVANKGEVFNASTQVKRTAIYDSLTTVFRKEGEEGTGSKEGYYARLSARDNIGVGDCYRIKTYRNDTLFMKPQELNLAYDASFSKGGSTDGTSFILPIRNAVNRRDEPYKVGDKIQIDIISLTEPTFDYLNNVRTQQQNGGLFANPPANVGTNLINANPQSKEQALGWFSVSARVTKTIVVKK